MSSALKRRAQIALLLLLLGVTGLASVLSLRPATPAGVSAPAADFSAHRALTRIEQMARGPHPTGSAANARVRDYLVGELRRLGLAPATSTRHVARTFPGRTHLAGTVTNIHAVLPGHRPTGRVLLVAHYDSVPTGPGASDDGAGVAAVLEVVRALRSGPAPANDVHVLLTDGEEPGLLGARAFVDSAGAGWAGRTVVLNLEARGTGGPAVMFQTAGGVTGLLPAVAASGAVTTSVSDAVYGLLPNDTDLTVFAEAGFRGLNFAFFSGSSHYHTARDDIAHLSPASVQDMGDAVLAAARSLAAADLGRDGGGEATYFTLLGWTVHYPGWLVLPLAVGTAAAYGFVVWYARRDGLRPGRTALAGAAFLVPLAAAGLIGVGGWRALVLLRPEYAGFELGDPHRPAPYAFGMAAALVVTLTSWYRWARRSCSPMELSLAVLGWFTALGLVTAVAVPGGSYPFVLPALAGCAATAAALRWTREESHWRLLAGAVAALPATALLLPLVLLLFPTLGISLAVAPLVVAAFALATALPLMEVAPGRRSRTGGQVAAAIAVPVLVGAGLAADDYDVHRPRPVSLGYVLDADTGRARWLSASAVADPTVEHLLTDGPRRVDGAFPNLPGEYLSGTAHGTRTPPPPDLRVLGSAERSGVREVRLRLRAGQVADNVAVYADTSSHQVVSGAVNGAALTGGRNRGFTSTAWKWGFGYSGPPAEGLELTLRVRGAGPVPLRVVTQQAGLPAGGPVLPQAATWSAYPSVAGQTFVGRTFRV